MRRLMYVFLFLLLASCGSEKTADLASASRSEAKSPTVTIATILSRIDGAKYREGELLVKFRTGGIQASSVRLHQKTGASVIKRFTMVPELEHVRLPASTTVREAISQYMSDPNVEYAEPNYIKRARRTPNDPKFNLQWALLNSGQTAGGTSGADIRAAGAWDISTGSADVVIAVIDTGIDYSHPDLSANIWNNPTDSTANGVDEDGNGKTDDIRGWNFVSNSNNVMDDNGHGTHVSGIAGAVGNNSIGICGLMWQVKLMPLKILDSEGSGMISDEIAAIQYALDKHVRILNMSFSGGDYSQAEFDAISAANKAGSLIVTAAGNGADGITGTNNDTIGAYPANYKLPNIISVAATDRSDRLAQFSNYGLNSVHVGAPGDEILSTYPSRFAPSGYQYDSGTSMATPYVSGLTGLLLSQYSHFTASQVRGTILRYVDILPSLQGATISGGRINALSALSSLLPPSGLSLSVQSTATVHLSWKDNALGEDGYSVERSADSGPYAAITSLPSNASEFTDSSLRDGTSYSYRVKAFNSLPNPPVAAVTAESDAAESTTIIPLIPPTGLSGSARSGSGLTLTWTDNSAAEDGYEIERKDPVNGFLRIASTGPNTTSFTDSGLSPETAYTYHIRAFNSATGYSEYSNDVTITTLNASQTGTDSGGGGGGCSIGTRRNTASTVADGAVFLIPLVMLLIKRRRKY